MNRVEFKFKNGHKRMLSQRQADLLSKAGVGSYATRMMVAETQVPPTPAISDDLDAMGKEELHALAKERGVKVHHMLGAEKVREALRAQ
jgi:hypothetical protein